LKTDQKPGDFHENRPVEFDFFFLQNFEIKNYKKTRVDFKIFGENGIKKFEETNAANIG
jgi:hypothetical protein